MRMRPDYSGHCLQRPWSDHEREVLEANWSSKTASEMTRLLPGRSRCAILGRVHRDGLTKPDGE